ncbi:MAG: protein kinase [Blastocatellia bacterium]|nr:protein kinase [Blastocatellia bacterium]
MFDATLRPYFQKANAHTTMTITTGTRFGPYEVTALLGKGGMGEVCLAEDMRLQRKVALKLLPVEFTRDSERLRRFALEAKTASGLNHPNILTIYDIGEAQSTHFIATEYIAGETLRARLQRPLALDETLSITLQIAQALAAAHEAGIIHRDIKPENVMVRKDGLVKVLDFGLAKLTERRSDGAKERLGEDDPTLALPVADSHTTEVGTVMGTASYMSPEQARGEKVDARSDIFSLGVVLYELLAGKRPFEGVNMLDIIGAVLRQEPASLVNAPAEAQRIVTKALQKDRAARYQSAHDFARDLQELKDELAYQARAARTSGETEGLGTQASRLPASEANTLIAANPLSASESAPPASASGTIALPGAARFLGTRNVVIALTVLAVVVVATFFYFQRQPALTDKDTILLADFENKTGDAVFDGTLKQALAVHLGQSPFLNLFADERVRETLRLMNRSPDERITPAVGREICQRQSLKAMLTGTIASLGRNYVINLEAINGQTGDVLAREQGEAEGKEQVLRTLGEAATRLREKLGESLGSIQKFDAPLEQATTSSLEALKVYSLGIEQNEKGKVFEAISSFKHAIELDPNFARAYGALATTYNNSNQQGLAAEAARRAFELREQVSQREKLRIAYEYYSKETGELHKAIEVLELSTQMYPRDGETRNNLAFRYTSIGQDEKAIEEYHEAIRLNPSRGMPFASLAGVFIRLNRFEEAKAMGEQSLAQKFDAAYLHSFLYNIAFIHGDTAAMKQQVDWASARPGEFNHLYWQAGAAAFVGQWQKAREFANRAAEITKQRKLQGWTGELVSSNAERAAVLGHCQQSRADLARAAALPRTAIALFRASMALALCGKVPQAEELNSAAVKLYPQNTIVNEINLPLIRAALELQRGNRIQAVQILQAASRYESVSNFYQNYLRGQAWLGERNGAAAAREFQVILDHRGWEPRSPLFPLAHLGLARAALLTGDTAKASKSYQDFFALWKDADADLPVLIEAKKEYAKLK